MKVEFLERNTEFAFNILNGLLNRPDFSNLSKLSEAMRELSSQIYSDVTYKFVEYGVSAASSSINPYLRLEDISFHVKFID